MAQTFMFPTVRSLGTVPGVAAGAKLNVKIPPSGVKHGFFLICKTAGGVALTAAQIKADLGDIIIRIKGETKIEASATELLIIQKYFGDANVAGNVSGVLPIFLTPRDLATYQERKALAWGMSGIDSITMEINVVGVAQLATLELFEYATDEQNVALGTHLTIRRFPNAFATTGVQEVSDLLNNVPDMAYRTLFIQKNTATITGVSVKVNNSLAYDNVAEPLNDVLNEDGNRKAQSTHYAIDFSRNRDLSGMLPMKGITDFRVSVTWATNAPTSYSIIGLIYKGLK